ncbi:DNA cross-link repair 1A protein [Mugil cephalus]|uniref:DNA cross-link repair 1A protein n=1 Tax=Mugil cephalus TaxID=48193 RepID=UPI001FB68EC3|nr:DNA cross-link repair 1A protein [Mugil cephalus]
MSQKDDSEKDIWDYRPLKKTKKRHAPPSEAVTKRKCTFRRTSKKKEEDFSLSAKSEDNDAKAAGRGDVGVTGVEGCGNLEPNYLPSPAKDDDDAAEGSSSGDFCPICQMPFYILVVQSQRWHVAECLDTPRDQCKECPDGLQCSSTIPNHYKKFDHSYLAHSRAHGDAGLLSVIREEAGTNLRCLPGSTNKEAGGCVLEASPDSAFSLSDISTHSVSPPSDHNVTPKSKLANGLLKLRSPAPEDFKKKKGWMSSSKSQKSVTSSQESTKELSSTPVNELSRSLPSPENDDMISYSPLSEFPAEAEDHNGNECRKSLFNNDENKDEDSMVLFSDSFSSDDELLAEFIDNNLEVNNLPEEEEASSPSTQLGSVSSLAPPNQSTASAFTGNRADHSEGKAACSKSNEIGTTSFQSPQRIVLERLRETILSSGNSNSIQTLQLPTTPPSQNVPVPRSQSMAPRRGLGSKAGQASGLKQTDIGVFFGLKPAKEKEKEEPQGEPTLDASETSGRRRQRGPRAPRGSRQRASKADATVETSQAAAETGDGSSLVDGQVETGRGGSRGWRRKRWNRVGPDGEVQLPRCPFYKKIPGTRFAVDAFQYGEIDGITAYFLTHFHSDHYGGLTKNSTLPIYCNRITGNLVKSKLKVAEQYVHVLPMNTEVTVDGVRVVLLDANHCPGAAMLLFFLPDGQTVLHTGDFRADPSMETYPELLGCRVQTLYLDTTYCSPEYTFPRQQEVINFAASTAFELVTLSPRTLVVCGSYSVGKEKVFLALADVLGSKVCLSRDKYNTMCCLESEQVRERITTDWKAAQVHVLPMMQLNVKKLRDHLSRFSGQYDQLVAFKPTGWTFSQQAESVEDIQPQISGNVSIYGVPYSEHSSFLELKRFVQWLRPLKIIPTVNNGSWAGRKAMEKCFGEWLRETRAKL